MIDRAILTRKGSTQVHLHRNPMPCLFILILSLFICVFIFSDLIYAYNTSTNASFDTLQESFGDDNTYILADEEEYSLEMEEPSDRNDEIKFKFKSSSPIVNLSIKMDFTALMPCYSPTKGRIENVSLNIITSKDGNEYYTSSAVTWSSILDTFTPCAITQVNVKVQNDGTTILSKLYGTSQTVFVPPRQLLVYAAWSLDWIYTVPEYDVVTHYGISQYQHDISIPFIIRGWNPGYVDKTKANLSLTIIDPTTDTLCNQSIISNNIISAGQNDPQWLMSSITLGDIIKSCQNDSSTETEADTDTETTTNWYNNIDNIKFMIKWDIPSSHSYILYNTSVESRNTMSFRPEILIKQEDIHITVLNTLIDRNSYPAEVPIPGNKITITTTTNKVMTLHCLVYGYTPDGLSQWPIGQYDIIPSNTESTLHTFELESNDIGLLRPWYNRHVSIGIDHCYGELPGFDAIVYHHNKADYTQYITFWDTIALSYATLTVPIFDNSINRDIFTLTLYSSHIDGYYTTSIQILGAYNTYDSAVLVPFKYIYATGILLPITTIDQPIYIQTINIPYSHIIKGIYKDQPTLTGTIKQISDLQIHASVDNTTSTFDTAKYTILCPASIVGMQCSQDERCKDQYTNLNQCSGHGKVEMRATDCDTKCTCDTDWAGDDCSLALTCEAAIQDLPPCPYGESAIGEKNEQGICTAHCHCTPDRLGCSNHGIHIEQPDGSCSSECQCDPHWSGSTCDQYTPCNNKCDPQTTICNTDGTCSCLYSSGWSLLPSNNPLEQQKCRQSCPCQPHGTCLWEPHLTCQCNEGYSGQMCQIIDSNTQCTPNLFAPSVCAKGTLVCPSSSSSQPQCECFDNSSIWRTDVSQLSPDGIGIYCNMCMLKDPNNPDRCSINGTHRVSYTASRCQNQQCLCKSKYTGDKCQYNAVYGIITFNTDNSSSIIPSDGTLSSIQPAIYYNNILEYLRTNVLNNIINFIPQPNIQYIDIYRSYLDSVPAQLSTDMTNQWVCPNKQKPYLPSSSSSSSSSSNDDIMYLCPSKYKYIFVINRSLITENIMRNTNDNIIHNNNTNDNMNILASSLDSLYNAWNDAITNMPSTLTDPLGPSDTPGIYDAEYCQSLIDQGIDQTQLPSQCLQDIDYMDDTWEDEAVADDTTFTPLPLPLPEKSTKGRTKWTGIIIGIVVGVVVLLALGMFGLWYMKRNATGCFKPQEQRRTPKKFSQGKATGTAKTGNPHRGSLPLSSSSSPPPKPANGKIQPPLLAPALSSSNYHVTRATGSSITMADVSSQKSSSSDHTGGVQQQATSLPQVNATTTPTAAGEISLPSTTIASNPTAVETSSNKSKTDGSIYITPYLYTPGSNPTADQDTRPISDEWKRVVDPDGKPYYYNSTTLVTSWVHPDDIRSADAPQDSW